MTNLGPDAWAYAAVAVLAVVAAVTDVRAGKIYNWTTYPAILAGLIGHGLLGGLWGRAGCMGLGDAALGLAMGAGPLWLARLAGGMGGGDVKLMGAIGALAGWEFALATMFYGFAVAAVMALVILLRKRMLRQTLSRIGRFLLLLFVRMKPASPTTPESPTLAFGLALCIGAALALTILCILGK